ncbi:hypothetical protein EVG20_g6382 [Dentipellis fragilis]|uniref:Transcription factor CBF/NF-Y/archaeal histone domain-containing protein n=1 Tax=Dentipellis fragilis TaxID=205917 RepID=A0A4Y9YP15_9AGAM|nr:hypothetical protein EVG20_g6382 [Dentipellis fragilis]
MEAKADADVVIRTYPLVVRLRTWSRIKKIMQKDEEVGKVAQATPVVISKALELFLQMIIEESSKVTVSRGSKKVEAYHLKHAVDTTEMLDFLKEIVQNVPDPSAGGTINVDLPAPDAGASTSTAKRTRKGKKAAGAEENGEDGPAPPKRRRRKKAEPAPAQASAAKAEEAGDDEEEEEERIYGGFARREENWDEEDEGGEREQGDDDRRPLTCLALHPVSQVVGDFCIMYKADPLSQPSLGRPIVYQRTGRCLINALPVELIDEIFACVWYRQKHHWQRCNDRHAIRSVCLFWNERAIRLWAEIYNSDERRCLCPKITTLLGRSEFHTSESSWDLNPSRREVLTTLVLNHGRSQLVGLLRVLKECPKLSSFKVTDDSIVAEPLGETPPAVELSELKILSISGSSDGWRMSSVMDLISFLLTPQLHTLSLKLCSLDTTAPLLNVLSKSMSQSVEVLLLKFDGWIRLDDLGLKERLPYFFKELHQLRTLSVDEGTMLVVADAMMTPGVIPNLTTIAWTGETESTLQDVVKRRREIGKPVSEIKINDDYMPVDSLADSGWLSENVNSFEILPETDKLFELSPPNTDVGENGHVQAATEHVQVDSKVLEKKRVAAAFLRAPLSEAVLQKFEDEFAKARERTEWFAVQVDRTVRPSTSSLLDALAPLSKLILTCI